MWRSTMITSCACFVMVFLTSALIAGERQMTDLREQNLSSEEIGQVLFPSVVPGLGNVRGLPKPGTTQAVETSIALNVLFELNSAKILPQYHPQLDKLGTALTAPQYQAYRVQIEGHTDDTGSEPYNQALSERRAESIRAYLVERFNIDSKRLVVKGIGEVNPVVPNDTAEARSKNRRVEVVSLGL